MNSSIRNPYIGPRTFLENERDRFFGRDTEARDLLALVVSERLVIFYAQSGAGKSSLVNTCLIPDLRARGHKIFTGRVAGDTPEGIKPDNVFVFNLLRSLAVRERNAASLAAQTISEFLQQHIGSAAEAGEDEESNVLIIDQFEEIFSTHHEEWEKREGFFKQLAQALQDEPYLVIVLVMREDYIASLDPYSHLVPSRFRRRYYMQRLEREAALEAIKKPVEKIRPYDDGAAERLVNDLSGIKIQRVDEMTETQPGQFVEAVQLQLVCFKLWKGLELGDRITFQDLAKLGHVDLALEEHYAERVREVAERKKVSEGAIREWFGKKLITPSGTRNMVLRNPRKVEGELPDDVIQALQSDLVRAEQRGASAFYELTHDRLVDPILKNNKEWFSQNSSILQQQAALWANKGRGEGLLLQGAELRMAEKEAESLELTDEEQAFLEACRSSRRRRTTLWVATVLVIIVMAGLSVEAVQQRHVAVKNALLAEKNREVAEQNAVTARDNAVKAEEATRRATAGQYAALAEAGAQNELVPSLLLGIEAYQIMDTLETRGALLDIVNASPHFVQPLYGHEDAVISVAYSPDGRMLASAGQDNKIFLWDITTHQPLEEPLNGHKASILSVAFSPDGTLLASGSDDDTIILWDVKMHQPIGQPLKGHTDSVHSLAFSPDGTILASGSWDNTVILWDAATRLPIGEPLIGHTGDVYAVAFSPDGRILASGSLDTTIILWDVAMRTPIGQPLQANGSYVESVAFSPNGKILASAGFDGTITLWDAATSQPIGPLKGHSSWVSTLAFSPDGKTLASGSADGTIIFWEVATRQPQDKPLTGAGSVIRSIAFSPDGKTLASGDLDKTVILWDLSARPRLSQFLSEHKNRVGSVVISADGETLASGSVDSTFILWNASTLRPIGLPHTDLGNFEVAAVALDQSVNLLAAGGHSTGIFLWDLKKNTPRASLKTNEKTYDYVYSLAFSPDGKILASGTWEDAIILWDVDALKRIGDPLEGHKPSTEAHRLKITSLAFSPNSGMLASASEDKTIILWDMNADRPQPLAILRGHTGPVYGIAFNPDGSILASAGFDGNIILWDTQTFKSIGQPLTGHIGSVQAVAFSPDGQTLASGGTDQSVILWDPIAARPIGQPLNAHRGPISSLVFSPDGKALFAGSNVVIRWDLDPQSWLEISCQRAGRNFTQTEWSQYFPNEEYRKTCDQWPLEPEIKVTETP